MQAYPASLLQATAATLARRRMTNVILEELRQSAQASPATEDVAVVARQRSAPLTSEALIREMNNRSPRQLQRWGMLIELESLRASLDCAPLDHQQNQAFMRACKLEARAARRPTPRVLLALAGVLIAVGLVLPPSQAQARIICFFLAAVALSPLLIRPALDWLEDKADRTRPAPLPSMDSQRARVRELESILGRMNAGLPA